MTSPLQSPVLLYQLEMASAILGIPTEPVVGFKGTHDRNPHKSWHNFRELAEKQTVAVIIISHTYTRRGIHPPGKLPTFLMYFHFCAFKFIQFFPYCCLINNNDTCSHKKYEFSGKQSLKEMWSYSCRCHTFPFSCNVIHSSHTFLIINMNDVSPTAVQRNIHYKET